MIVRVGRNRSSSSIHRAGCSRKSPQIMSKRRTRDRLPVGFVAHGRCPRADRAVPVFWQAPMPGSGRVAPISNRLVELSTHLAPVTPTRMSLVVTLGLELCILSEKLRIWSGRCDLNARFDPPCTSPSHSGVATSSPVATRALAPAFAFASSSSSLEKKQGVRAVTRSSWFRTSALRYLREDRCAGFSMEIQSRRIMPKNKTLGVDCRVKFVPKYC
jgi:hypothetical protein